MTEKKITRKNIFEENEIIFPEDILTLFANALGCMKLWATPAQIRFIRRSKLLEELKQKYLNG